MEQRLSARMELILGGAALSALRLEPKLSWALASEGLRLFLKQSCDPAPPLTICHPERRISAREADGYQVEGPCVFRKLHSRSGEFSSNPQFGPSPYRTQPGAKFLDRDGAELLIWGGAAL